jgi:predicted metalloprotease with PDZ domain
VKKRSYGLTLLVLLFWSFTATAQTTSVIIEVLSVVPPKARISLRTESAQTDWAFKNSYASVLGLSDRIDNIKAQNLKGDSVPVAKVAPGIYRTRQAALLRYEISLVEPSRPADRSHVSWLKRDLGFLMPADLLPAIAVDKPIQLRLILPPTWKAVTGSPQINGTYTVAVIDKAVFLISPSLRILNKRIGSKEFRVAMTGAWPFQDEEVQESATKVLKDYTRINGTSFPENSLLMLTPADSGPKTWTAETRGNNLVLLLSPNETKQQLLGRLSIILTHELLHLWVPNALALTGDYDWFFEGFTLYQALLSSLRLKLINFEEYLRTLARVYDSYQAVEERDRWSLLELSERRWTSQSSLLYDKGILVAMLFDLTLKEQSKTRSGLTELYSNLHRSSATTQADGNEVIIEMLNRLVKYDFASIYIRTAGPIEVKSLLPKFGIRVESIGNQTRFVVADHPTKLQLKLLKSLGYRK